MRVLWVEDFGASSDAESIGGVVFRGILSSQRLDALTNTQRRGRLKDRPEGYERWREWNASQPISDEPEIDIYRRWQDFDDLLKSGYLVDRYDSVLLDINLEENNFFPPGTVPDPSLGGFWLYNKLVGAGFPSRRIALLTAYNSLEATREFQEECTRVGHEGLRAFGKSDQEAGDWISSLANANGRFLGLRRGALDGIAFAENLLAKHGDSAIRFNDYLGGNENLSFDQALDYLHSVRHSLPVRVTASEMDLQLRGFRNLLACEWDRAVAKRARDPYYQALGQVMKLLRNWSSHGHLLDRTNVGAIAYLVLASLRTGFRVPANDEPDLRSYERRLLAAIGRKADVDPIVLSRRLANSYASVRSTLQQKVKKQEKSRSRKDKDGKPDLLQDRGTFHEMVNELAGAKQPPSSFDFPSGLRDVFIHVTLLPDGPTIGDDASMNFEFIEKGYSRALQGRLGSLPAWVEETWARL